MAGENSGHRASISCHVSHTDVGTHRYTHTQHDHRGTDQGQKHYHHSFNTYTSKTVLPRNFLLFFTHFFLCNSHNRLILRKKPKEKKKEKEKSLYFLHIQNLGKKKTFFFTLSEVLQNLPSMGIRQFFFSFFFLQQGLKDHFKLQ